MQGGDTQGSMSSINTQSDPTLPIWSLQNFQRIDLPVIETHLGNIPILSLLDSGAAINMMSVHTLNRLSDYRNLENPNFSIKTITGIELSTQKAIQCEVKIQNQVFTTNFVISNTTLSSSFDIILGIQFLCSNNLTLDCANKLLRGPGISLPWKSCTNFSNFQLPEVQRDNLQHKVEEIHNINLGILIGKVKIPPFSQQVVRIRIKNPGQVEPGQIVLTQPNTYAGDTKYFVANAISQVSDLHSCNAQVLNTTSETLTLNKGAKLVSVEILDMSNIPTNNVDINTLTREKSHNLIDKFDLSHLHNDDRLRVQNLIENYSDVFANDIGQLGNCELIKHRIHLTDDIPTRQKPYRVPYNLKQEMKKQINDHLDAGIIQHSTSSYAAPVLLVRKADNTYRLVADLRKLNEKTLPDNFPIPNLTEMIDMLNGAKFFSSLDLTSGFNQMSLHPDDAHFTGIATEEGVFEYRRLPFGLRNASSSFQRLMSIVLTGLSDLQIAVYIDDVVIASKTIGEHIERLELVFERLRQANLKLKPKKCSLLKDEITYLGHRVSEGKVMPDLKNIQAITLTQPPKNRKQVRGFLGLTGFYRRFIPQYAKTALPLTNLTKESNPFAWTHVEQEAFDQLKQSLVREPCLKLPDFDRPFAICTDASKFSLGAVLVQDDEQGFQHPISFAARKLNDTEVKYSVFEKEALGVVFGIQQFKQYLYGREFKVYCDQKSMSQIFKLKDPTSRIARWIMTLQEFSYEIIHKPGRLNQMADYLSRAKYIPSHEHPETTPKHIYNINMDTQNFGFGVMSEAIIISKQKQDDMCREIVKKINSNFKFPPSSPHFYIHKGILVCKNLNNGRHNGPRLVVPKSLVHLVLQYCHDNNAVAHSGLSRTLHRVKQNFFWIGMYKMSKQYVGSCHSCVQRRGFCKPAKAPLQKIPVPSRPFEKCSIDAVGPLVTSRHGNKWILVICDYFTRYPEAYPVSDIQSNTVARVLIDFISRHGLMQVLYSDRGSNFLSQAMTQVYNILGIDKQHTVSYNPGGNGMLERLNKTLIDTLSHLVSETQDDWCEHIPLALMAFRTAFHRTIQETPAFLLYGRDIAMPYDLIFSSKFRTYNDTPTYAQNLVSRLQTTFEIVKKNLEKAADTQVEQSLEKHSYRKIDVGDTVYLHTPKIKIHTSKKLSKQNQGPYRVMRKSSPVLFEIVLIADPTKIQKVHMNRLIKVEMRQPFPYQNDNNEVDLQIADSVAGEHEEQCKILYPPLMLPIDLNHPYLWHCIGSHVNGVGNISSYDTCGSLSESPNMLGLNPENAQVTDEIINLNVSPQGTLPQANQACTSSREQIGASEIPASKHGYNLRSRDNCGFVTKM